MIDALKSRAFSGCAVLVSVVVVAGCGDTVVDKQKLDDTTQASLEDSLREKIRVVDCPSDLDVDPGTTFNCDVTFPDGQQSIATLEIRNEDADISIVGFKTDQ